MEAFGKNFNPDDFKIDPKEMEKFQQDMEQFRKQFNADAFKIDQKQMDELKREMEEMRKSMPELFQLNRQQLDQLRREMQELRSELEPPASSWRSQLLRSKGAGGICRRPSCLCAQKYMRSVNARCVESLSIPHPARASLFSVTRASPVERRLHGEHRYQLVWRYRLAPRGGGRC